jgi:hypothetical protein
MKIKIPGFVFLLLAFLPSSLISAWIVAVGVASGKEMTFSKVVDIYGIITIATLASFGLLIYLFGSSNSEEQ